MRSRIRSGWKAESTRIATLAPILWLTTTGMAWHLQEEVSEVAPKIPAGRRILESTGEMIPRILVGDGRRTRILGRRRTRSALPIFLQLRTPHLNQTPHHLQKTPHHPQTPHQKTHRTIARCVVTIARPWAYLQELVLYAFCSRNYAYQPQVSRQQLSKDFDMRKANARLDLEQGCDFEARGQFSSAIKSYLKAAKHGNVEAQVNLGNLYDEGKGCRQSAESAVHWYKRAVRSGSAEAAYNLGVHYQRRGISRWAVYWFKRAAHLGDQDAKGELRKIVKKNSPQA
jgi:hypothetical protein